MYVEKLVISLPSELLRATYRMLQVYKSDKVHTYVDKLVPLHSSLQCLVDTL